MSPIFPYFQLFSFYVSQSNKGEVTFQKAIRKFVRKKFRQYRLYFCSHDDDINQSKAISKHIDNLSILLLERYALNTMQ